MTSYVNQQSQGDAPAMPASGSEASTPGDNPVALKLLVNNNVAGSLIGKGGSSITELQSKSGARVKLSQANDFFPNTRDRIALVIGSIPTVNKAKSLILERVFQDQLQQNSQAQGAPENKMLEAGSAALDDEATMTAKFVIPARSAGVLIGQGGANIRELHEQSGARLQLHNRREDGNFQELLKERVVTVTGTYASCCRAIEMSLWKLVEENSPESPAGTMKYSNMTTSYSRIMSNHVMSSLSAAAASYMGAAMPMQGQMYPPVYPGFDNRGQSGPGYGESSVATVTMTLPVPDQLVGALLGRGGSRITEIQQISGARVSVSQRGDYIPGTQNRMVTIVGSQQAAQTAQLLIHSKLEQASPAPVGTQQYASHAQQPGMHAALPMQQGGVTHYQPNPDMPAPWL